MKRGKHLVATTNNSSRSAKSSRNLIKKLSPALLILLVVAVSVGGTIAWLTANTNSVVNTFTPAQVSCTVTESFSGTVKSNVNVTNTSDIDAYLRVRLVTYRVNGQNQRIGGVATIPEFTPGNGWQKVGNYYYYTSPVAPGGKPATDLISSINLQTYNDADGGKQVIEVMAEAIQAAGVSGSTPIWKAAWTTAPMA